MKGSNFVTFAVGALGAWLAVAGGLEIVRHNFQGGAMGLALGLGIVLLCVKVLKMHVGIEGPITKEPTAREIVLEFEETLKDLIENNYPPQTVKDIHLNMLRYIEEYKKLKNIA